MTDKASVILGGTVEKIIEVQGHPELAQLAIDGTDEMCSEIRIENSITGRNGDDVRLKKGAKIKITLEADKPRPHPNRNLPCRSN